jgi:hypothetical protein
MFGIGAEIAMLPVFVPGEEMSRFIEDLRLLASGEE